MQADIFNVEVKKLTTEQGPGMGAAMIAAVGCHWFDDIKACANTFLNESEAYEPIPENVQKYEELFMIYLDVYVKTQELNKQLVSFRS